MRKSRVTVAFIIAFVLAVFVLPYNGIASSLNQESVSYVVRRGDNLSSIANRYGSSVSAIVQANGLASTVIWPGQTLVIPSSGQDSAPSRSRSPAASPGSGAVAGGSYVVHSGDTLGSIASRYGVSVSALRSVNGLSGDVILTGQMLSIPSSSGSGAGSSSSAVSPSRASSGGSTCGGSYTVKPGDTLYSIAGRCGVSVKRLREANGISGSAIYRGQALTIPSGSSSTPGSPATQSAAPPSYVPPSAASGAVPVQAPASQSNTVLPSPTPVPPFPSLFYPTPGS